MIIYSEVNWSTPGVKQNRIDNNIEGGKPLAFIIDSIVVETMATDRWFADLMESVDSFQENLTESRENFYAIDLIKDNQIIETLVCSEKIRAILLSNPVVVGYTLEQHKYAEIVTDGWSYVNGDFIIPGEME
jgi:hypothetical protein